MYINCISCGHKFDIGKSYDDYEGPVRCPTCRARTTGFRWLRAFILSIAATITVNGQYFND